MPGRCTVNVGLLMLLLSPFTAVSAQEPATRPTVPPRTPDSAVTAAPSQRGPARHEQFMYRIKEGEVGLLFLGDSITDFWPRTGENSWLKFAPFHPANFGVSGERTEQLLWRLTNGELDAVHPKLVVLMIGTNNIGQRPADKPEWAAAGVAKVLETIHQRLPDSKVLLLGVFPRDLKDSSKRADVNKINVIISRLDDGHKTRYMDIGRVFLDADGEIPADIMADKLHPTAKGYDLWYDAIHATVKEMMQ